ncbi:uncharacterized protein LOC129613552 [Condylostylus longicornis]|uniref:uncharacterized protein LOC129613552 n=1 Tax=Condylostylus longicornis TaxID=2530218 RepID=UPI00244E39B6|nr:uncharacterized protein LOC129613552 [Condylostylus longicornis]
MENCPTDSILTMVPETTLPTTTVTTTLATTTSTSTTTTTTTTTTVPPPLSTIMESEEEPDENMITKHSETDSSLPIEKLSSLDNEEDLETNGEMVSKSLENLNNTDSAITSTSTTTSTTTPKPKRNRKKNRTTEPPEERQLKKRSLRYHHRESIKIVPGDYRNFDEYFRRYYNQKWKRSISFPETSDTISELRSKRALSSSTTSVSSDNHMSVFKECCPKKIPTCICRNDCQRPVCVDTKQILVQTKPGNASHPGQCCPEYVCVDSEPDCSLYMKTEKIFWPSKCRMCQCIHGIKFCHEICPQPNQHSYIESNCYSDNTLERKLFKEGETWKEDDCTDCECENGVRRCFTVQCSAMYNCKIQRKLPGECCPICDDDNLKATTTTTSSTSEIPITTVKMEDIITTTTTELTTISTVTSCPTSSSDLEPSKRISNFIQDNIVPLLMVAIVALLLAIIIVFVLYIKALRKGKKNNYLSIPNGDSNSSQNHIENGPNTNGNHHHHHHHNHHNHHNSQHSNSSSN